MIPNSRDSALATRPQQGFNPKTAYKDTAVLPVWFCPFFFFFKGKEGNDTERGKLITGPHQCYKKGATHFHDPYVCGVMGSPVLKIKKK